MTVTELYSIADRIDQLAADAWGFNWSAVQIIEEVRQLADYIREDADVLAEAIAETYQENA